MTDSGQSDFREQWDRDRAEILGPIRREVGYPDDPSDPDEWPAGRHPEEITYEYIAALENMIVAERRVRRDVIFR